ncbi:MAG: PIN domain-containing protein [Acidobacteriota bacterium]|jgi:toxin-antitoxin system PIN domain toxin|nr:PIN domain-containing protein [Acidobacteriota bacterium]
MILIDNNILLYAFVDEGKPENEKALRWLESALLDKYNPLVISPVSILGFIRVATNEKVFNPPLPIKTAEKIVLDLLSHPNVRLLTFSTNHFAELFNFIKDKKLTSRTTTDAHLAVLAQTVGATVATNDKDFKNFKGIRWFNPLKS